MDQFGTGGGISRTMMGVRWFLVRCEASGYRPSEARFLLSDVAPQLPWLGRKTRRKPIGRGAKANSPQFVS